MINLDDRRSGVDRSRVKCSLNKAYTIFHLVSSIMCLYRADSINLPSAIHILQVSHLSSPTRRIIFEVRKIVKIVRALFERSRWCPDIVRDMIMRRKLRIIFERPNPFAVSRFRSNPSFLMGDDAWNMIHVRQHNVALLLHPLCVLPRVPYSDQSNLVSHRNTLLEIETI